MRRTLAENKSKNRDDADTWFETTENATTGHKLRKKVQNSGRRMPLTTDQQYSADTKQDETPRAPQEIKRERAGGANPLKPVRQRDITIPTCTVADLIKSY